MFTHRDPGEGSRFLGLLPYLGLRPPLAKPKERQGKTREPLSPSALLEIPGRESGQSKTVSVLSLGTAGQEGCERLPASRQGQLCFETRSPVIQAGLELVMESGMIPTF